MADDFFSQRYKTQRANQDVSQDVTALETFGDEKQEDDPFASENQQPANPFQKQLMDDEDNSAGYTMDDLLNGYVIDEDTLSAIDECLIHISSEWDLSDILSKDLTDCEQLIVQKCNEAHSTILSSIIDPPNVLYDTLLRLARKMKAMSLVLGNQKMIYVPQNIEELAEISSQLQGITSILSIRADKRTKHQTVVDRALSDDDYKNQNDEDNDEDMDIPEPKPANNDMFGENVSKDLEAMIFSGRKLYKDTATCKKLERKYLHSKKKKISIMGVKKLSPVLKAGKPQDKMEKQIDINNVTTGADTGAGTNDVSTAELTAVKRELSGGSGELGKAHPHDIKCEGCGNLISFVTEYNNVICYKVPIKTNQLFYFHDTFCVTLRRLKESIRRYVLDQSLPEARRAETTVGYIRNLLTNFSTLITTGGTLPRPNPVVSSNTKASDRHDEKLKMMHFVRSSAHKLILRQQALEGREAKNFEDEYSWKFANIPQSVQYTDMVVYGPCLAKYVIQQLLSKQLESLWLTLAFVVSGMTATTSLQIIEEHRPALAKVKDMEHLDVVLTSMIEAADYTIAMALYLSAYMMENAERDLSRSEDFEEVGTKYIRIASQLVASVESDHLLSLLLETPTDIAHLSVFEIAIKNGIDDFMDDSRIQMLMAHMWSEFDFLDPGKNYRTQDIELFDVLGRLATQPARFYYCPVGRYWTESVMYMVYICVVSAVVLEANYELSSPWSGAEYVMWIFNVGFVAGEITQMAFDGVSYLTDVGNYFDILIMINWVILALMRFGCQSIFSGSEQCYASNAHDTVENGLSRNKNAVLIYMAVFCAQICILWSRVCLIFSTSREVGPFISMIPGMVRDILKWTFVLGIFYIGYSFGSYFIIAGDVSELCAADGSLDSFSVVAEYNFYLLMGQSEWSSLEVNDCMDRSRSLLLKLYMFGFSILGTILLLNLLIAMMASTYEKIREGTAKQVNFSRAEQVFSLSHSNAIIPPPLNVLVFAFSILWIFLEFLVWVCSCGNYILNIEKLVPVFIDYSAGLDQANKNARNEDITALKCCKVFQKLKSRSGLLQKVATNRAETARYCQFCRCYMRVNGNISHYFKLFVNYRLDEADVKFMKSLMQNAGICPQCYRPYRIYEVTETGLKTNRLYRWQVVLEVVSFYVFMLVIYLGLIILIALPALFNALFALIDDVTSATKIVEGNRQIIKDDKYVQLVENVVEKEGTTDSQVLSTQVTQLNRKLIQVKMNQQSTANVLAEQSMELEEHSRILKGMVPYIKQIDTKIDKSHSTVKILHREQIDAFQSGMQQQSVKLEQSKDVLDAHTSYNKSHEQQLVEQMLVAKHHADEMDMFKQQLDELKILREKDEQLKREQAQRQEDLEKQHAAEIQSFNKELKQQRVLREIEVAKQEKLSKKQNEELKQAHVQQVNNLEKQIQKQEFLRAIEEQKIIEEQEKRELLQEKQAQDMAILSAQMDQLRIMKEAEEKKRQIELKMRRRQQKKMKDVEKEILRIKQSKKRKKKTDDSFALQQSARMGQLQSELIQMKVEQEKKKKEDIQQKEVAEIKEIQHKSRVQQLREQMSKMIREQKQNESVQQATQRKAEKKRMKHKIQMEKMKHSMTRLQLVDSSENAVDVDDEKKEEENVEEVEDKMAALVGGGSKEWSQKLEFSEHEDEVSDKKKEYVIAVTGTSDDSGDKDKPSGGDGDGDDDDGDDDDGDDDDGDDDDDSGAWVIGIRG